MKVRYADENLAQLERDPSFTAGLQPNVVRAFRKVMWAIRQALDERDLRNMRSLNLEKLKGQRSHQMSMRLNKKWRLVVEIEQGEPKNTVVIVSLENHYGD